MLEKHNTGGESLILRDTVKTPLLNWPTLKVECDLKAQFLCVCGSFSFCFFHEPPELSKDVGLDGNQTALNHNLPSRKRKQERQTADEKCFFPRVGQSGQPAHLFSG